MKRIILTPMFFLGLCFSGYSSDTNDIPRVSIVQNIDGENTSFSTVNKNNNAKNYTYKISSDLDDVNNVRVLDLPLGENNLTIGDDSYVSDNKEDVDIDIKISHFKNEAKYTIVNKTDGIVSYKLLIKNKNGSTSYKGTTVEPHNSISSSFPIAKKKLSNLNNSSVVQSWADTAIGYVNVLTNVGGGGRYNITNTTSITITPTTELLVSDNFDNSCQSGDINLPIAPNSRASEAYNCYFATIYHARGFFPFKSEMRANKTPGTYDKYAVDSSNVQIK